MRARHRTGKTYYFLDTGTKPRREVALGTDYVLAVQKWAELTSMAKPEAAVSTFRHAAERYQREVIPEKAPETQKDNARELANLLKFFHDPAPLDEIEPQHVRQYLDWRKDAPVRAKREKALLSHIFNFARECGLTARANPCAGIRGKAEKGRRDVYIDDTVFRAVWDAAETHLRDAMDLAYLTGQRPADVRKMTREDVRNGAVAVKQGKTGAKLRVEVMGELANVIERVNARKVAGLTLAAKEGKALTKYMLRGAFDRARAAAIKANPEMAEAIRAFQFRDLRAKAGTDTEESRGMAAARDQLGHTSEKMTAHYVRHRLGKLVQPTR
jgi:integrase